MKASVKNSTQVVEKQVVNKGVNTQTTENQVVKLSKVQKLEKSVQIGLSESANRYQQLLAISSNAKLEMFSLSKVYQTFIDYSVIQGKAMLTDKQKGLLTFERIKQVVNASEKLKVKRIFSLHDVVLICNRILSENDKGVQIAKKVTKQGGVITAKK